MDFTDLDAPMGALARVCGVIYKPLGVQECDVCEGTGEIDDERYRDMQAWAVARVDQFIAAQKEYAG